MNNVLIHNAKIVTPNQIVEPGSIWIKDGKIAEFQPGITSLVGQESYEIINGAGQFLLPGLIDIHTDAIEKEISPRPGANFPLEAAFRALERKMSGIGITTVYHSMYLGYYQADLNNRSSYERANIFRTIGQLCQQPSIIRNKVHLRFEITGVKEFDLCLRLIEEGMVHLLSFMDHTPGQGQFGLINFKERLMEEGKSVQEIEEIVAENNAIPRLSEEQIRTIVDKCYHHQVPVASHDDDSPEKVLAMKSLGADICEFPINEAAAQKGKSLGMPTVGGASNILRGGSLSGNLNIQEAVGKGLIDVLCSDYYPPSLLYAIFKLNAEGTVPLNEAVNLTTLNPAKATNLDTHIGSIEIGKSADLILVKMVNETPIVTHTFVDGRLAASARIH